MTLTTIKTLTQVEQRFRRDELERTEIATELRLLRERLNSIYESQLSGGSSAPHSALTLDANADVFLSINAGLQILGADVQGANKVFAGPTVAPDAHPNFRLLVDDDVIAALLTPGTLTTTTTNVVTGNHTHAITNTSDAAGTVSTILAGTAAGDLSLRRLALDDRLIHDGDPDTYLEFTPDLITLNVGSALLLSLFEGVQNEVIINDGAASDVDFRVEGGGSPWALFMRGSDGNVGIGTSSPATELDVNGSLTLSGGSQSQLVFGSGDELAIQGQTTGLSSKVSLYSNDGDGTDNVTLSVFGVGTPGVTTNRERVALRYAAGAGAMELFSEADGTGTLRPLILYTEGNTNQLYLEIDGNVGIGTAGPDAKLDVLATTTQFRLTYTDGIVFTDFALGASHDLTITPSSTGQILLDSNVTLTSGHDLIVPSLISHLGDLDTSVSFATDQISFLAGGEIMLSLIESAQDEVVVNQISQDIDFRVEGATDTHLIFAEAGTNRVGIRTSGPATELDVNGDITMAGSLIHGGDTDTKIAYTLDVITFTAGGVALLTLTESTQDEVLINTAGVDVDFRVRSGASTHSLFVEANTGRVSINHGSPATELDVVGSITVSNNIVHGGDTNTNIAFTPDAQAFTAGGVTLLTLTEAAQDLVEIGPGSGDVDIDFNGDMFLQGSDGNFGVGVSSPSAALHVRRNATVVQLVAENTGDSTLQRVAEISFLHLVAEGARIQCTKESGDVDGMSMAFHTEPVGGSLTERVRITSDGEVGIGTAAPDAKLHLSGGDAIFESGLILGGTNVVSINDGNFLFDSEAGINRGLLYRAQESAVYNSRFFIKFDTTNDASFPFLTNRAPSGAVVIKTGTAAGAAENEHFRVEGGDGTVNSYFTNSKLGLGTTTIPHGAIGVAMLALDGADSSSDGPHIQITTASDNYPLMQIHAFTHDNVGIGFDAYWNGAAEASADAGSNYTITKNNDLLKFSYASGAAQGTTPTFTVGLTMDTSGMVGIGTPANTKMTIGLTIDQGTNDDEILSLKSSDVAHGMTSITETDVYFMMRKSSATVGGAVLHSFRESGAPVFNANASGGTGVTTKTTSSVGHFLFSAKLASGTSVTNLGANANIAVFRNNATARWILDAEGDIFYGGSDDGTITDEHDDVRLLSGFRAVMSPKKSPAHDRFKGFLQQTEDILVQQGVLTQRLSEGGLVSDTALKGLIIDALIQITNRLNTLEEKNGPI